MTATYDAIVVGMGGVGSAAIYHLAKRGLKVLGLDRFPPGHDRGSSHGQTRIIRQAYFEHPGYVPLLLRSYKLWTDLEEAANEKLLHQIGLMEVGPPDGVVLPGVLESAKTHDLKVDRLTAKEAGERFPGFRIPERCEAVFEQDAGYLLVEGCVLAHLRVAQGCMAELRYGQVVKRWEVDGGGVLVHTENDRVRAGMLVIAAGAWTTEVLSSLGIRLRILRKHMHWMANEDRHFRQESNCPAFFFEINDGYFYGFPQIDELGVKVAEHSGGEVVSDPLNISREPDPIDFKRITSFLEGVAPGISHRSVHHSVCMYTMTPDDHFVIDRHPEHHQVVFAGGLSGHGFKFTTVLGEALADLATVGKTKLPIEMFRASRFANDRP